MGAHAFENIYCLNINTSTFPSCLTYIGDYAFSWSDELVGDVKLTTNCKYLGYRSFYTSGLHGKVTIPSSITTIPSESFMRTGITSVSLPDNLVTVSAYAFDGCSKLDMGDCVFPDTLEYTGPKSSDSLHLLRKSTLTILAITLV
ncbi:leucine-rich repeat domain-containing protein [Butyrivibrio sp. MC2021]|uniref:leucine-rich repeat domain-containing protein n=1 Tax=Butyrivibrio sp. MC2021 TaxID=1408306 RepID=UPI0009E04930